MNKLKKIFFDKIEDYICKLDNSAKNDKIILSLHNDKNEFEKRYQNIFNYLDKIKFITLIKPHEVQCENFKCDFVIGGKSIFSDNNHLSKDGSLLMEKLLLKIIKDSGIEK